MVLKKRINRRIQLKTKRLDFGHKSMEYFWVAGLARFRVSAVCADKTGSWKIGTKTKSWCKNAAKQTDTLDFCDQKDLWDDCPVTCGKCS